VIRGLAKNAHEGMAGRRAIWVWSLLLLGGYLLPLALVLSGLISGAGGIGWYVALAALAIGLASRLAIALRFRQSVLGALLHPLGVLILVAIQWYARMLRRAGRGVAWKDRAQTPE
jgi:hypothetical protein